MSLTTEDRAYYRSEAGKRIGSRDKTATILSSWVIQLCNAYDELEAERDELLDKIEQVN